MKPMLTGVQAGILSWICLWSLLCAAPLKSAMITEAPFFKSYEAAVQAFNAGDYAQARKHVEASLADCPQNILALYLAGEVYFATEAFEQSLEAYRKADRLYPKWPETWRRMAYLLARLGQSEEAVRLYRRSLQSEPDHAPALSHLANLLLDARRLDEAQEVLELLARLEPNREEHWLRLSQTWIGMGNLERAAASLESGTRRIRTPEILRNLALLYFDQENHSKAYPLFEELLKTSSGQAPDYYYAGVISYVRGDVQKAGEHLEHATALDPTFFDACYNLGVVRIDEDRIQEALKLFEQCIRIDPGAKEVYRIMGRIYEERLMDPEKARAYYEKAR